MKIKKLLLATILTVAFLSCGDDDSNVIDLIDSLDNGAVVQVTDTNSDTLFSDNLEGALNTTLEYRDAQSGNLLDTMDVYVTFFDNSEEAGDSSNAIVDQEVLLSTIQSDAFNPGENNFPVLNLLVNTEDFLEITNNTLEGIEPGDRYNIRFELTLTDGRVFSSNNIGDNGGLSSDFNIIVNVL